MMCLLLLLVNYSSSAIVMSVDFGTKYIKVGYFQESLTSNVTILENEFSSRKFLNAMALCEQRTFYESLATGQKHSSSCAFYEDILDLKQM